MTRKLILAGMLFLAPFTVRAQCAAYRTSVYTNIYGVRVTMSGGVSQTTVSNAFQTWNSGCGFSGGSNYPMFGFDSSYRGNLTVQLVPGHRSEPVDGAYPRGTWDPNTQTITIWEEAGNPPNWALWANNTEDQRLRTLRHEFGHALGLRDDSCFGSIMNSPPPPNAGIHPDECAAADQATFVPFEGTANEGCESLADCRMSPILIDVSHNGVHLTGVDEGVLFDLDGNGAPELTAWTAAGADEAFLWMDRNGNGVVDDGTELFGSARGANGFEALASFDLPNEGDVLWGGNGDGVIDSSDRVWTNLRLWTDEDHNGVCTPAEVTTLDGRGVYAIDLGYRWTGKRDPHGNQFRYQSAVLIEKSGRVVHGPMYDVYFVVRP